MCLLVVSMKRRNNTVKTEQYSRDFLQFSRPTRPNAATSPSFQNTNPIRECFFSFGILFCTAKEKAQITLQQQLMAAKTRNNNQHYIKPQQQSYSNP